MKTICALMMIFAVTATRISAAETAEPVAVFSSAMLYQVAREAGADGAGIRLVNLQPAGRCPGHFDVRPQQWTDVRRAKIILCHDYQSALRERLEAMRDVKAPVIVSTPGSYLVPAHHLLLLEQVADALGQAFPEKREHFHREKDAALHRWTERTASLREQARPWAGVPVISSVMQQEFCTWLGLDVVGVLPRPEDLTPRAFAALRRSSARAVIGNLQSDGEAAASLGQRMAIPVAILSNFPEAAGYGNDVEALMESNLQRLHRALATPSASKSKVQEEIVPDT